MKKTRGRPKLPIDEKRYPISSYIASQELSQIENLAEQTNQPKSTVIASLIKIGLKKGVKHGILQQTEECSDDNKTGQDF